MIYLLLAPLVFSAGFVFGALLASEKHADVARSQSTGRGLGEVPKNRGL